MAASMSDHRRSFVRVDLDAIRRNVTIIRQHMPHGCAFGAVVKADGYGHGAVPTARAALAGGASWLLVATVPEGEELRRAGLTDVPILILGAVAMEEAVDLVDAALIPTLDDGSPYQEIAAAATARGIAPYPVHMKVDTGLNRFGVTLEHALAFARCIDGTRGLRLDGLSTHLATADVLNDPFLHEQAGRLTSVVAELEAEGLRPRVVHAANSGAALQDVACWDMVRIGIAMYGIPPAADFPMPRGICSALSVHSRVARILELKAGATIGYGRTFRASGQMRVALVPLGYADGMPRSASNRGAVLIGGMRCPLVGLVSMDQCVVALPEGLPVRIDDPVTIVGTQRGETQTLTELARDAGTISYELAVRFGARMRREYEATTILGGV